MIRAFEIQTYRAGVWQVDSVFDDEELAVFEARSLFDRGRYVGVRVIQEDYNEETDHLAVRTVLKLSKTEGTNAVARKRQSETDRELRKVRKRTKEIRQGKKKKITAKKAKRKARKGWIALGARLMVVVVLGLALLVGLRMVFQVM